MDYTQNLNLPQWEASDRIMRTDFNDAFEALDTAAAAAGNCRIVTGSYVGAGECGAEHPNTLEFDFHPMLVVVTGEAGGDYRIVAGVGCSGAWAHLGGNSNYGRLALTWGERSLSWYCTSNSSYSPVAGQLNTAGAAYRYLAFGIAE